MLVCPPAVSCLKQRQPQLELRRRTRTTQRQCLYPVTTRGRRLNPVAPLADHQTAVIPSNPRSSLPAGAGQLFLLQINGRPEGTGRRSPVIGPGPRRDLEQMVGDAFRLPPIETLAVTGPCAAVVVVAAASPR